MTADLELWLRGLWRHPNPCRHLRVVEAQTPFMETLYICRDCQQRARISQTTLQNCRELGRVPVLTWELT